MGLARRCDLDGVKAIDRRAVEKTKLHISARLVFRHVSCPPARKAFRGSDERVNKLGRRIDLDRVLDVGHFEALFFHRHEFSSRLNKRSFQDRFAFFGFDALFFDLAAGDFGLREAPYSKAFATHAVSSLLSRITDGGTAAYSRMGRPAIGSKIFVL